MNLEVELKFPVSSIRDVEHKLHKIGARLGDPQLQHDRYYAHPSRDFAVTDEAFRTRQVGQRNYVTYKGPKLDRTSKTRREIELLLEPGSEISQQSGELLEALGFTVVAEVRKRRRVATITWQSREVEIALDDVEEVGQFVELEIQAPQSEIEPARSALASLAAELGLANSERRSYLELLLANRKKM